MNATCLGCGSHFKIAPSRRGKYCSPKCWLPVLHKGNVKHGHAGRTGKRSSTYKIWQGMLKRCTNPSPRMFQHYLGRGIQVCQRWYSFPNFLADMGERPKGLTLERINNNGNYEPGNCKWATRFEQNANTRRNRLLTFNGQTKHLFGWAREMGIKSSTLNHRFVDGWPIEEMLTIPVGSLKTRTRRKHPAPQGAGTPCELNGSND